MRGVNRASGAATEGGTITAAGETSGARPENDQVADATLAARLYASPAVHRLVPASLAMAIAATVGPSMRQRRNPQEKAHVEEFVRDLLMHTPRAGETEALTREWHKERARLRELFWRPWLLRHSRVYDREHWDAAHSPGRGCVVVFGHLVATWAAPAILELNGFDHYVIVSPHYFQALPPGYEGLAVLHRRREYGEKVYPSGRAIPSDQPPARLLELLQGGATLACAFDVPGWAATPFLGRNVAISGGPATLAFKTKSKVLPVIPERHGSRIDVRMLAPLDPDDYPDLPSLRVAIAKTFEPFVLKAPEAVELAWNPSPLVSEVPPGHLPTAERGARSPAA